MANEFQTVWENENAPEYALDKAHLSFVAPHIMYQAKQLIVPVSGSHTQLTLKGNSVFKMITELGEHKLYKVANDITFSPASLLDTGTALEAGKDYHIYLVTNDSTNGALVVSKNATYPTGATAANSRRIGGFHTLCLSVGSAQNASHPLYGYVASDILPQSAWDLIHKPKSCNPQGMVYDPATDIWVDIYLQSGTGSNTKSVYNGTITDTQSWDSHQEDLNAVHKRMLTDHEFTSMAWGTIAYSNISGSKDPVTTGGHVDLNGKRIISNIGCEDCCGVLHQWIDYVGTPYGVWDKSNWGSDNSPWMDASPTDQGKTYGRLNAVRAGGMWTLAMSAGPRFRDTSGSRTDCAGDLSCRGACDSLSIL